MKEIILCVIFAFFLTSCSMNSNCRKISDLEKQKQIEFIIRGYPTTSIIGKSGNVLQERLARLASTDSTKTIINE